MLFFSFYVTEFFFSFESVKRKLTVRLFHLMAYQTPDRYLMPNPVYTYILFLSEKFGSNFIFERIKTYLFAHS